MYFLSKHSMKLSMFFLPNSQCPPLCLFLQVISPSRKRVTSFQIRTKIRT